MSLMTPTYGPAKFGALQAPAIDPNSTQTSMVPKASAGTPVHEVAHPNNPLVALGVIAAITFGCMAFSTSASVRVGHQKATAGISIGDTK